MNWQPIETAPVDGTAILLTDGALFAAGRRTFEIARDWKYKGYNAAGQIGPDFTDRIPNPDAGKRTERWELWGCSAFTADAETYKDEYNCSVHFDPTHWAALQPPAALRAAAPVKPEEG